MSDYPPLIFIAVCAGEKKLVKHWAASGDLPNIARLLGTGYTVDTESLHGLYVGANWPSLQTACHPGKITRRRQRSVRLRACARTDDRDP